MTGRFRAGASRRPAVISAAALALAIAAGQPVWGQAAAGPAATPAAASPTTRVLAVGHLTGPMTAGDQQSIMPGEVRDTVELYLAGKIADWYVRKDQPGVVFILDVRSADEARELTAALPLVKAGRMEFQFIPLGPLTPLRLLTK